MKFSKLYFLAGVLAAGFAYVTLSSNSGGVTGMAIAGCSGANCHGAQNANTVITLTGWPINGYAANTPYTLTLTVTNPNYTQANNHKAGFDLQVSAGTLSGAPAGTALNGTTEIRHTSPQSLTGSSASWVFTWTSPATSTGTVSFNVAANMVNANNQSSGDAWNKTTFTVTPQANPAPVLVSSNSTVIGTTTVVIDASVNPNGNSVTPTCDYGLTTSYGSSVTMSPSLLTGTTATPTGTMLTSLSPNTTYHYRVRLNYGATSVINGTDKTFKTWGLGINYIANSQVKVSPNPATSALTISGIATLGKINGVQIMSINGQTLHAPTQNNTTSLSVDISSLLPGNYLLYITTEKGTIAQQFVKQ